MPPPAARPVAIIGETAVKVTPWSRGSRTPTFQKPTDWMIDAMPQVKRSALIRWNELLLRQPDGVGEQDRDDQGAGVEREDVLDAVDRELAGRQDLVDRVLHGTAGGSDCGAVRHGPPRERKTDFRYSEIGDPVKRCAVTTACPAGAQEDAAKRAARYARHPPYAEMSVTSGCVR